MYIQIDKSSAAASVGSNSYVKDGKHYARIENILYISSLFHDFIAQKSLASVLQSSEDSEACLEDIGKFLDSRNGYGPLGNFRGRNNLFPLLGILRDNRPDALMAFADKIEPVFTAFAQQKPPHFFQLCGHLGNTPDILSQIVSQGTYRLATENYFSNFHKTNFHSQQKFSIAQNLYAFKLHVLGEFIWQLKKVPAYRDAARAGIADALANHVKADRTDACVAVVSGLGEYEKNKELLANVSADTVSKIAHSIEAKAAQEELRPDLMPLIYAFKGLQGLEGIAPTQIQEQINRVSDEIDRSYARDRKNASYQRDRLRGDLVALTDAALNIPGGKEAVLIPETVHKVTTYVSSASSSAQRSQEFVGDVCSLFYVLRNDRPLSDCAATRAISNGIISDGHWGIFPVPDDKGKLGLRVYELAIDGSRAGHWRGELPSLMRKLRNDGNTDAFNGLKSLLTKHEKSYPTQPAELRQSLAAMTKEFC